MRLKLNYCWSLSPRAFFFACSNSSCMQHALLYAYMRRERTSLYTSCTRDAYMFRELMPSVICDVNNVTYIFFFEIRNILSVTYFLNNYNWYCPLLCSFLLFSVYAHIACTMFLFTGNYTHAFGQNDVIF